MRAIIFIGCFLVVAGSAWAQFGEDPWEPATGRQSNPPGYYYYGQLPVPSTSESLQGFDAWYQQQRNQHRQQHERYQQEVRQLQPNPPYYYGPSPVPSTLGSVQGFDAWYQQQREHQRQQHERYQQEARQHELNQMNRLREYDRLRRGPLQPY